MGTAEQLHHQASLALNRRRYDRARVLLDRAHAAAGGDADLGARIAGSRAFLLFETGHREEGLRLATDAVALAGGGPTLGVVTCQQALLHLRAGDQAAALRCFDAGLPLLEDPGDRARGFNNRGNLFLTQGRASEAADDFETAAECFAAGGLEDEAAIPVHNLGYVRMLQGDYVEALRLMDSVRATLAATSPIGAAICDQDRSEVLLAAGLVTEGTRALLDASRTYGARRMHQRAGESLLALARHALVADPTAALAHARAARARFRRSGADAHVTRAEAVILSAEVELGRRGPSLVTRADRLAEELAGQDLPGNAAIASLHGARVVIRRGGLADAADRLAAVDLGPEPSLGLTLLRHTAAVELARADDRAGDALAQVREGLDALASWHSTFGSLDLQTFVVGRGHVLARAGMSLAAGSGDPGLVLEWSERARTLATQVRPVRPPADPETVGRLARLRHLGAGSDGVRVPTLEERELRRQVRESAWARTGSGEVARHLDVAELREQLGPDAALVVWLVADGRITGLVVTDEGQWLHDLGALERVTTPLLDLHPELELAASDLPGPFAAPVRGGIVDRLALLSERLVAPLLPRIGDRDVVATPSGALAGTPWSLLPGLVGRAVTVAPSATWWRDHRLGVGARPTSAGFVAGPRLPHARAEVEASARAWPGADVLVGSAVTEAAVTDLASRVDVLHVAAHGRHAVDNPLFSGLELVDGPWFGYDIDRLERVPALVVLSSCELGRSSVRFGEELVGMTAAWLHAGARCVIASPAAVNDEVASRVLTEVHRSLAQGASPSAALAGAVPPASEDEPPAPFVCFGAGF